ncbi:superinfection exclusion B family protein [Marinobacter hydrocarbonoclasticus]|nr:superinfection exclusion B family protein [Marinobacter nauticus]
MAQFLALLRQLPVGPILGQLAMWTLLASLALLWLPLSTLQSLFLKGWVESNGFWLGLGVVGSATYLLAWALRLGFGELLTRQKRERRRAQISEKLTVLDGSERAVLREFFLQSKSMVAMPLNHPAVEELKSSGVLEQVGNVEHYAIEGPVATMKIAATARSGLTRQALRLPEGAPSETQRAALLAARPEFANSLARSRRAA